MSGSSGGGKKPPDIKTSFTHPVDGPPGSPAPNPQDSSTMTTAGGRDSDQSQPQRMRSFAEILSGDKLHRNILEIKLIRTSKVLETGETVKARTLTEADISEFLFDEINLKVEDCLGIALRTHRYDTKEVKLKKGVDPTQYIRTKPIMFKDHEITVTKQMNNLTKVTLKNVPLNVPDEEIIHLCKVYGEPVMNKVDYKHPTRISRGIPGSTRYVEMKMNPGMQFENFYWVEGPLSDDQGCRITVLHAGQVQQCSHCLRRAPSCPGGGNGKACESLKTERGKLADYMRYLKEKLNYTSLKMMYLQEQFPALGASSPDIGGFGNIVEKEVAEEDQEPANTCTLSDFNALREELTHTKAQLRVEKNLAWKASKKLEHVEKVASQRIVETMPSENFEENTNHLTMLLATVLKHDDFEYDENSDKVEPKSSEFLRGIEENCQNIPDKEAKLSAVRNKVLEKMKRTVRRERRLSTGSVSSLGTTKSESKIRQRSEDESEYDGAQKFSKLCPPPKSRLPGPNKSLTQ